LFVALRDRGTNEDAPEEQNENDNPETDATAALTKKSSSQFWYFWTPQRWQTELPDNRVNFQEAYR
jgi:hypothetical protein